MKILVTGGAGYIGSHAVRWLLRAGHDVLVYDNLSRGHRAAVPEGRLIVGELADDERLTQLLCDESIEAVMHFGAFALVGESMRDPALYYRNNVLGTVALLEAMRRSGVWRLVFSSTTATHGVPDRMPIKEDTPQQPINPYGATKLACERALDDYARAYGLGHVALRYFNAAGATPEGDLGEDHDPETHLIPIVLQVALGRRPAITILGDDFPTPDGTCIRDYVHVEDLAQAHLKALDLLEPGIGRKFCLGTGSGTSVREIVDACRRVTGHPIPEEIGERRPGDPPELVADASLAREVLGWDPQYPDVDQVVETAWRWHRSHPDGFGD